MDLTDFTFYLVSESNTPEIPLYPGMEYSIGRSPNSAILLSDGAVSRHHALLSYQKGIWILKDLESTNGTMVNGINIEMKSLTTLDKITLGRITFTFKIRKRTANGNITMVPGHSDLINKELDQIIDHVSEPHMKNQLQGFKEKLSRASKNLLDLAYNDELTGLFNRRYFDKTLEMEFRRSLRYNRPLTLIMIDIDHFKIFNDKYGHQKGDSVLRTVGTILKDNCRSSDIVCRYGGEEMSLILPEQDSKQGTATSEKLRKLVATLAAEIEGVEITASFGVSSLKKEDSSSDDLIKRSDQALYKAKESGRNCTVCST